MSKKSKQSAAEVPLMILTNERTPHKAQMLLMLYKAASLAQLAYMDGMDPETGEIHQLIVGLEPTPDGKFNVFPLAKIFNKLDAIPQYLVPDGHGSYLDYRIDKSDSPGDLAPKAEAGETEELGKSEDGNGGALGGPTDPPVQRRKRRRRSVQSTEVADEGVSKAGEE